ncbi:MAG TPA: hypothetical protein VHL59_03250, partial [Thermoanaerobaculia bacterium]|nr:hypothetical protein [Thermoanaerobaculia bacterium]
MIFGRRWLIAAVIAIAIAGALWRLRDEAPMRRLATSVPADVRFVTARMSGGFPWAPLADTARNGDARDVRRMELMAAVGQVVSELSEVEGSEARHAMAVAYFLGGEPASAIRRFDEVAENQRGATYWSDLAAVRYTIATRDGSLEELQDALTAADHALRLEPGLPEALFNRALILEQFHFRDSAAEAWKAYLATDDEGGWRAEARRRLEALTRAIPVFASEVERLYPALQRGDREAAQTL